MVSCDTRTVPGRVLAQLLRVEYDTLRSPDWREKLPPVSAGALHPRYSMSAITAFLNVLPRGFETPPTAYDLVSGRLELLKPEEALRLVPRMRMQQLMKRSRWGRVASLKVSGAVRFSKAGVLELAEMPEAFTPAEVCHILGIGKWHTVLVNYVKTGRLVAIPNPDKHNRLLVLRGSLINLLSEQLPEWIDPQDWIEDRLATGYPLIRKPEAAKLAAVGDQDIVQLTKEGKLQFVWGPSNTERMICPESLVVYIEQFPMSWAQIANAYGVSVQAVQMWRRMGRYDCAAHRHSDDSRVYRACVVAFLCEHLSPGMKAGLWLTKRSGTELPLFTLAKSAEMLQMSKQELKAAAESGEIGGVSTPNGVWHFSPQRITILSYKKRRETAGAA